MVEFSFDGMFKTTSKGIPPFTNATNSADFAPGTTMTVSYFFMSLILQCIIFLIFFFYFCLSIYRVVKKIKNNKFLDIEDSQNNQEQAKQGESVIKDGQGSQNKEGNDKLIYKFDEEEQEDQYAQGKHKERKKEGQDEEAQQDYDSIHDDSEEAFIELDQKLIFLMPFLISFIVSNSVFTCNFLTLICLGLMLVTYFLFNIKGLLANIRIMPLVFMVPAVLGFATFFINDHDITT